MTAYSQMLPEKKNYPISNYFHTFQIKLIITALSFIMN